MAANKPLQQLLAEADEELHDLHSTTSSLQSNQSNGDFFSSLSSSDADTTVSHSRLHRSRTKFKPGASPLKSSVDSRLLVAQKQAALDREKVDFSVPLVFLKALFSLVLVSELCLLSQDQHQRDVEALQAEIAQLTEERNHFKALHTQERHNRAAQSQSAHSQMQAELEALRSQLQAAEHTSPSKAKVIADIKAALRDSQALLTEKEYAQLAKVPPEQLSVVDFVRMRYYRTLDGCRQDHENLAAQLQLARQSAAQLKKDKAHLEEQVDAARVDLADCRRRNLELESALKAFARKDGRGSQYDAMQLATSLSENNAKEAYAVIQEMELRIETYLSERDEMQTQLSQAQQHLQILRLDKTHLEKQNVDLESRCARLEEHSLLLQRDLSDMKKAREEMFEKFLDTRNIDKSASDERMRKELEVIRERNKAELEELRRVAQSVHEREVTSLRAERDSAQQMYRETQLELKESKARQDEIFAEFRKCQLDSESALGALRADLKMRDFENGRLEMLYEQQRLQVKDLNQTIDTLRRKLEVATKEFYDLKHGTDRQIAEKNARLREMEEVAETYRALESELDQVVLQAAQADIGDAMLQGLMVGSSTSQRKLKQAVALARQLLASQKENSRLRKDVEDLQQRLKTLNEQLKNSEDLLSQSHQPHQYLIATVKQRDDVIAEQKGQIAALESDVAQLKRERQALATDRDELAADLDDALQHGARRARHSAASAKPVKQHSSHAADETGASSFNARPITIVGEAPWWFSKLKAHS
eukprot:m.216563 g.216563  ORF g.216563 m.216563 type:complete len:766 (+) comp22219_c0_seq3:23-2320(+)